MHIRGQNAYLKTIPVLKNQAASVKSNNLSGTFKGNRS